MDVKKNTRSKLSLTALLFSNRFIKSPIIRIAIIFAIIIACLLMIKVAIMAFYITVFMLVAFLILGTWQRFTKLKKSKTLN
ncbi:MULTISPECIES: hypothetical protein [Pseudoalteromonas]|jgi:hypothetical protein|uniref:Uncharacterized protein n=1 Tax=Pseudoalteromonas neustonica TaxID=1840331 RepID=A0ABY3F7P2_9GAMM|nr:MULTISPECIES: hypothetical protein [Pseudoalteromonas]MBB1291519.1 hypothetical protein [Pseudoalteromonas sp. SR41-4]MBB1302758.1 hypothetical protein [Pseudoalteromonas sp. SR44-8]MBB1307998.1 hypothetical protein [Pseudoalteromonas sp. SR41-8]MBB1396069.1 hypothetical protein [Pseudoalteromonas sp. SG44-8]MBB1410847.1 hypothetical protein [Pseudoalteromonas sp. SG44-17]